MQFYRVQASSKVDVRWCQFLSVCLEEGVSMAAGDRILSIFTPHNEVQTTMTMSSLMRMIRD